MDTLRFSEEVLLLLLNEDKGKFVRVSDWSTRYAFGGSVLMDLALENRIDTDLEKLILLDSTPLGDPLLDPMLAQIVQEPETHDIRYWVEHAGALEDEIREGALERLIERGTLERREQRVLWVFRSQRYAIADDKPARQVKLRILNLLFSDELPTPRDIVTICLADACGIFHQLLTERELKQVATRIEQLRKMDLIGQTVSKVIWDIDASIASITPMQVY